MATVKRWFNLYFMAVLAVLLTGCASTKDPNDKLSTILRIYPEALPGGVIPTTQIIVYRANPVRVKVESLHMLTEENIVSARVVDQLGTYSIELKFDNWAEPMLEHRSSTYQGRRLGIQAQWGRKKETQSRWIAAPIIRRQIVNSTFTFTPDTTLEEAYEIVNGLNNNAQKVKKQLEW